MVGLSIGLDARVADALQGMAEAGGRPARTRGPGYAERLLHSVRRIEALTQDLTDRVRIQAGGLGLQRDRCSLRGLPQRLAQVHDVEPLPLRALRSGHGVGVEQDRVAGPEFQMALLSRYVAASSRPGPPKLPAWRRSL